MLAGLLAWLLLWALLVVVAAVVLPQIQWSAPAVGQWLGERAGMPVQVAAVRSHWTRRGPVLELQDLALGQGGQIQVGSARLQLAIYTGLLPDHALTQVHLQGLDLLVLADPDSTSAKAVKARQLGVRVIGEAELIALAAGGPAT